MKAVMRMLLIPMVRCGIGWRLDSGVREESQGWTALTVLRLEESLLEGEPTFEEEVSQAQSQVDLVLLVIHPEQHLSV
jgi:hypothetical protein